MGKFYQDTQKVKKKKKITFVPTVTIKLILN